jgi:SAM-dependent methyltransferase
MAGGESMVFRKSLPAAAVLFAAVAAAQDAQPRRAPDVPFVPTTPEAVQAMLTPADVKSTDVVYDLGCGDGRIVIAAAKDSGARAVGIDLDPQRIAEANANVKAAGVGDRVKIIEGNLFRSRYSRSHSGYAVPADARQRRAPSQAADGPAAGLARRFEHLPDGRLETGEGIDHRQPGGLLSHHLFLWTVPARSNTRK